MSKKRKNIKQRSRFPLILGVAGIYFVMLAGFVCAFSRSGISLSGFSGQNAFWMWLIYFLYYALPAFFSLLFGALFRPFWASFRNMWFTIVLLQLLFSGALFLWREQYIQNQADSVHAMNTSDIRLYRYRHKFYDQNTDGIIDKIKLSMKADIQGLPSGSYKVYWTLSQQGKELPEAKASVFSFTVKEKIIPDFVLHSQFDPRPLKDYFGKGDFDVNVFIEGQLEVGPEGERLLSFSRWAPFLRITSWAGEDPEICSQTVRLREFEEVHSFSIMPLRIN